MLLDNKVAIITGAASPRGIRKATARLFAQRAARIVVVDLEGIAGASAAANIGSEHVGLAADVTDKSACERVTHEVIERYGHIDVLVNNAGVTQAIRVADISLSDYDFVTGVSLRGMRPRGGARSST